MSFRPLHDWVVVRMEPIPEKEGSLYLLHGARQRVGTVVRTGPGKAVGRHRVPIGVTEGDRVVFFRENLEHSQGKQVQMLMHELGPDLGLIRAPDILFAVGAR